MILSERMELLGSRRNKESNHGKGSVCVWKRVPKISGEVLHMPHEVMSLVGLITVESHCIIDLYMSLIRRGKKQTG